MAAIQGKSYKSLESISASFKAAEDKAKGIVTQVQKVRLDTEKLATWTRKVSFETGEVLSSEMKLTNEVKKRAQEQEKAAVKAETERQRNAKSLQDTTRKSLKAIQTMKQFQADTNVKTNSFMNQGGSFISSDSP